MLSQGVTAEGLCKLILYLDTEQPARGQDMPGEFSWSCGAYVHGGVLGLRRATLAHPDVVRCLTHFMNQLLPELEYTTLVLMRNTRTPAHRDAHNAVGYLNALVPLSSFRKGELWLESAKGTVPCPDESCTSFGVLRSLDSPILFDAHTLHATCPWTHKDRVVLAAFTVRHFAKLATADHNALLGLGFRVPGQCTGDSLVSPPLKPLRSNCPVVFELFAGSARVTAALRNLGWAYAQAVDHQAKDIASANILINDLSTSEGQQLPRKTRCFTRYLTLSPDNLIPG